MAILERIDFFVDNQKIGQDLTDPFAYDWTAVGVGNHTCFARAVYDDGSYIDSPIHTFSVTAEATGGGGSGYLLDDHTAYLAYSIFKLRSDQQYAWRVAKDSDGTDYLDIGFDANGVVDVAAANSFLGNNGYLVRWYDATGNGRHWTNGSTYVKDSGSMPTVNGLPAAQNTNGSLILSAGISGVSAANLFSVISDDTTNRMAVLANSDGDFLGQADVDSTSETINRNAGTPSIFVNGSQFAGTTRGDLSNALRSAASTLVTFTGLDLSAWSTVDSGVSTLIMPPKYTQEYILFDTDVDRAVIEADQNARFNL